MVDTMDAAVLYGAKDIRIERLHMPVLLPGMVMLKIRRVGICGSDLHYFEDGYCGAFVPSRPFVLGHELVADVIAVNGNSVDMPPIGARVTVNPARSCGFCDHCKSGRGNLCRNTIMLGSGSTSPPTDGAMAEFVAVRADQCHLLPTDLDDGPGAMIEPLAVVLHAIKQAGGVSGRRILVTGAGTIGLLTAVTAKAFGSVAVVVTDILEERRQFALQCGIDFVLNPLSEKFPVGVKGIAGDGFDVVFEASGAVPALRQAFDLVRAGGTIVQIGTIGMEDVPLPANKLMVREIKFIGSFRYGNVFEEAIRLVESGRIDLRPFITGVFSINEIPYAMGLAADKKRSLKVQIHF
jgi:L-idonate 5-dehydrogenase